MKLEEIGNVIECLFEEHRFVRRSLVYWAPILITWTTVQMFKDITAITDEAVNAYAINTGLLTAVIGLYQWLRAREDNWDVDDDS